MQLVLDSNGLSLQKRNNAFWVVHKKGRRLISPHRVSSIAVVRYCLISAAAVRLAANHGIPIFFFSASGKAEAQLRSAGFGSIATIRRRQVLLAEQPAATSLIIGWFGLKTDGQLEVLRWLSGQRPHAYDYTKVMSFMSRQWQKMQQLEGQLLSQARPSLLGIEGSLAQRYWTAIGQSLQPAWQFKARSRRPAQDPFNSVLNYCYGMLYNVVENAALAAGLDPYLGFFHTDEYNRPTLVFDLIEPFRPWIDRMLIEQSLKNIPRQTYFEPKKGGIYLSKAGRMFYIPLFNEYLEERIDFRGKRLSRKNHIHYFAGRLAKSLNDEQSIPGEL